MNQKHIAMPLTFISRYLPAIIGAAMLCMVVSCKLFNRAPDLTHGSLAPEVPQVSWNILFKPGTDAGTINKVITNIKNYIRNFYGPVNTPKYLHDDIWCPCDPLLHNIGFSPVDAAGKSVTTPPPSKPGPAGSGDYEGVAAILDDTPITDTLRPLQGIEFYKNSPIVRNDVGVDSTKKIAIIDSGIDTTLFNSGIQNLIWGDPAGAASSTLFNFIPGQFNTWASDFTHVGHGSAVAAILIKAMDSTPQYPKLMILKALDENNRGSIFSVSCALSYALQKKATIINLSLGYYGEPDSILYHYLAQCRDASPSIPVFVAAGNTPGNHGPLCQPTDNHNLLAAGARLFYPACFTGDSAMTSVTQLSNKDASCIYQNYSNQFISLGVYDTSDCCAIKVGFLVNSSISLNYYEGSSFATPVASGLKMATILRDKDWNTMIRTDPGQRVTVGGKYIEYSSNSR